MQAVEADGESLRRRELVTVVVTCRFADYLAYPNYEVRPLFGFVDPNVVVVPTSSYWVQVLPKDLRLGPFPVIASGVANFATSTLISRHDVGAVRDFL